MKRPQWFSIAIVLLAFTSVLEAAEPNTPWLGVLWTKGGVSLGSAKVPSGSTVLPGDRITTDAGASAWIRFRSPASTTLLADTEVVLLASDSMPILVLHRGTMIVDEKVVDPVQVSVPGGYVLVKGDPQTGAECEMTTVAASRSGFLLPPGPRMRSTDLSPSVSTAAPGSERFSTRPRIKLCSSASISPSV